MDFRRGRLRDSDILYDIIDAEEYPTARSEMIMRLKHPRIFVFFPDTNDAVIAYEPMYGNMVPWVNVHVFSNKSIRGPRLMKFYLETGLWMSYNEGVEVITIVVPSSLGLRHSMFLSSMGADKRWDVDGNMMFTVDATKNEMYEERLKKLTEILGAQEAQED